MISFESEIELLNQKRQKLIHIENNTGRTSYKVQRKIGWNYACLSAYKSFLEILNRSQIPEKESILLKFHEEIVRESDNSINFHNFHVYLKKHEDLLTQFIPLETKVGIKCSNFLNQVKSEPSENILYEEIYEAKELQKFIKEQLGKIGENNKEAENAIQKISTEYKNLFLDDNYNHKIEDFFSKMYEFCHKDEYENTYHVPYYYYEDLADSIKNLFDYKLHKEITIEDKDNQDKRSLIENNKLQFLNTLYYFFLYPTEKLLNDTLKMTFPTVEKVKKPGYEETLITKRHYSFEPISQRNADKGFMYSQQNLQFFSEINENDFWKETNEYINLNNKFYLGRISEESEKQKEKNERLLTDAVLDVYHMQDVYKSIDSVFKFRGIDRTYLTKKIEINIKKAKEILQKKYAYTNYADIPDIFEELLKQQKYFYTVITDNNSSNDKEFKEFLDSFHTIDDNNMKEKILCGKYNSEGLNEFVKDFEAVVYNAAVIISGLHKNHFPEAKKADYYKQLTVLFPEIYTLIVS